MEDQQFHEPGSSFVHGIILGKLERPRSSWRADGDEDDDDELCGTRNEGTCAGEDDDDELCGTRNEGTCVGEDDDDDD